MSIPEATIHPPRSFSSKNPRGGLKQALMIETGKKIENSPHPQNTVT